MVLTILAGATASTILTNSAIAAAWTSIGVMLFPRIAESAVETCVIIGSATKGGGKYFSDLKSKAEKKWAKRRKKPVSKQESK